MDSLVYFISSADDHALFLKTVHFSPGHNGVHNSLNDNLALFLEKEELMGYLYRRIKVALPQPLAALVPNRLFQDEELPTYLASLTELTDGEQTIVDDLNWNEVKVCYQANVELVNILRKKFPTSHLYSLATPFLEAASTLRSNTRENYVALNVHENRLQLVHFSNGKVLFYNSFPFSAASDVMYYTLLVYEQFQLDPAKIPLILAGQVMESSDIYKMLYRYVGCLEFAGLPEYIQWNRKFNDLPSHLFFTLFGLSLGKS